MMTEVSFFKWTINLTSIFDAHSHVSGSGIGTSQPSEVMWLLHLVIFSLRMVCGGRFDVALKKNLNLLHMMRFGYFP